MCIILHIDDFFCTVDLRSLKKYLEKTPQVLFLQELYVIKLSVKTHQIKFNINSGIYMYDIILISDNICLILIVFKGEQLLTAFLLMCHNVGFFQEYFDRHFFLYFF